MVGRRWLVGCLLAALSLPGAAHELDLARFELRSGAEADAYQLVALIQNPPMRALEAELQWPPECLEIERREYEHGGRLRVDIDFSCEGGLAGGMSLRTPWGMDGGLFTHVAGPGPSFTTFCPDAWTASACPLVRPRPCSARWPR